MWIEETSLIWEADDSRGSDLKTLNMKWVIVSPPLIFLNISIFFSYRKRNGKILQFCVCDLASEVFSKREDKEFMALKKSRTIHYICGIVYFWCRWNLSLKACHFSKKKKSHREVGPRTITHIMTNDLQGFKEICGPLFKRKWSQAQIVVVRYLWYETRSGDWVRRGPEHCSSRLRAYPQSVLWKCCLFKSAVHLFSSINWVSVIYQTLF